MNGDIIKNKTGESINYGLILVLVSIAAFAIVFISENFKTTGFATIETQTNELSLREYNDVGSLRSLAPGNYYIDQDGIVYWLDDNSKPPIAKVNFVLDSQKNAHIYINNEGNIVLYTVLEE